MARLIQALSDLRVGQPVGGIQDRLSTNDIAIRTRVGARATLKLAGVIRGRTLLALVEAPDGLGYILKPGDTLGDGRVTEITQNAVTFAVAARGGQAATTATLRLAQD